MKYLLGFQVLYLFIYAELTEIIELFNKGRITKTDYEVVKLLKTRFKNPLHMFAENGPAMKSN